MPERTKLKATNSVGGLFCFVAQFRMRVCDIAILATVLACAAFGLQDNGSTSSSRIPQEPPKTSLSSSQLAELKARAESGDAEAETNLAAAYRSGNGLPQNDSLAAKWYRRAADQGFAMAENNLGTMYRLGEGVARDEEEAVRWYQKAAQHGSREAMFNLGTCYYNGDGVGSNEFTAYAWFLVADDAGNIAAKEAVQRSAATMTQGDTSKAYLQIAEMYEKGEALPKNDAQAVRWLRKAANIDSPGKLRLALRELTGPEGVRNYAEALDLCKAAAKDFAPALPCVGYIYRRGLGVTKDPAEALKWYQKGADSGNQVAIMVLAEMYATGEGTKIDRPAAFMLLLRAVQMRINGARTKAASLLQQMSKPEISETEKKLRGMHVDPKKVFEVIQTGSPS
jgi:TPR repeat protein